MVLALVQVLGILVEVEPQIHANWVYQRKKGKYSHRKEMSDSFCDSMWLRWYYLLLMSSYGRASSCSSYVVKTA